MGNLLRTSEVTVYSWRVTIQLLKIALRVFVVIALISSGLHIWWFKQDEPQQFAAALIHIKAKTLHFHKRDESKIPFTDSYGRSGEITLSTVRNTTGFIQSSDKLLHAAGKGAATGIFAGIAAIVVMILMFRITPLRRRLWPNARAAQSATNTELDKIIKNSNDLFKNPTDGFVGMGQVIGALFFDYRCSYCKSQLGVIEAFSKAHPDKRVIFKEFPILGPDSEFMAKVALATKKIHGNDSYIALQNALFAHPTPPNIAAIREILAKNNFDVGAITKAIDDPDIARQIANNQILAATLEIKSTPNFVLTKGIARGLITLASLEANT